MTDLTREEIQQAVEAVPGWKWVEEGFQAFAQNMTDEGEIEYFLITETPEGNILIDYHDCDGIALLVATGEDFGVDLTKEFRKWRAHLTGLTDHRRWYARGEGPDLTTAAVRAVNQWKEAKKETTP